ncbi:AraC family transcriptional regulator [Shewanella fidelis]|uniref:Helix-turn-helix transcriptional regulator n=1 Tax=Shewanella fidelis TaxID=173509 RepID=A0AAW8NHY6_9GAMM|nr:helix-turn-helix transcriptional regulator [Shewanella fidelis]MDR8522271.1 helix-turn-helix transcriptional regulator [Shewanella fidelis]MDW4812513.1 helix-turn-helix transcriptional regulator [Shewanella fidelis]MDW4816260.1 helix-turn-helix transcriptional regulator [Shewanella fidelis]MDW4820754.1 helix-turn-helix transcriptional regulator [Shewanella fidelis]MDW4824976.1 helix-turn-helix transcriptional regulator [Shewanella fidelis]
MQSVPNVDFRAPNINKSGVEILDLEHFYSKLARCKFCPSKPHRINYFCFIYITEGQGGHFVDFKYHPFQSGSFIFINKHQVHAFDLESRPKGKMINITEDFLNTILTNIRIPFFTPTHLVSSQQPLMSLSEALIETCEHLLYEINKAQEAEVSSNLLVQLLFSSLLVALATERKTESLHLSEAQAYRFQQFLLLIESKAATTREASEYAQMLHVSYKSLNLLCKQACGQTAKQLIDAHAILEIKRRLIIGSAKIQEIAFDLGFDDVTYFVKFFKRHTQLTPSQFKESRGLSC